MMDRKANKTETVAIVKYSNGDRIDASFQDKVKAINFLNYVAGK